MIYKKIVFLTGTRADYGKIKSIIQKLTKSNKFKIYIFVTGMHLQRKYGLTYKEIYKDFKKTKNLSIFKISNFIKSQKREIILSRTINIFSKFVDKVNPDLISSYPGTPPITIKGLSKFPSPITKSFELLFILQF